MTKYQLVKEIESLAKQAGYDAWSFYRCGLAMSYDYFKKAELEDIYNELILKVYGRPF